MLSQQIYRQQQGMQPRRPSLSPLQLMQRFYNEYSRTKMSCTLDYQDKYQPNKTNTTAKLTKFLTLHQHKDHTQSLALGGQSKFSQTIRHRTITPNRRRNNTSQQPKRSYFKNIYSDSHPFLRSANQIDEKPLPQDSLKTEPAELAYNHIYNTNKLMTPLENRKSLQLVKEKINKIRMEKKQRMEKVRYNYLVNNCYKGYKNSMEEVPLRRTNLTLANTHERIFPTSAGQLDA